MTKKAQVRVVPRIDTDELAETFTAQLETHVVCDALLDDGLLPSLGAGRGDPVRLYRCLLRGVTAGETKARGLRVQDCVFEAADLANMDWTGSVWERVECRATRLTGCLWTEARIKSVLFKECKMDLALLRMARLAQCEFVQCNLVEADFYGADLTGAIFRDCDMSRGDFSGTNLSGVDLRDCRLDSMRGMPARMDGLKISADQAAILIGLFGVTVVW